MILRTNTGIMVLKLDNYTAGRIISQCPGKWVEKTFVGDRKATVYEIASDMVWRMESKNAFRADNNYDITICFWEGYYLIHEGAI